MVLVRFRLNQHPHPSIVLQDTNTKTTVADWDIAPQIWKTAIAHRLTTTMNEHPLIMTEPAWNPPKNREKTLEIAFEDFSVPAFYLAKAGVCSACVHYATHFYSLLIPTPRTALALARLQRL